LLAQTIAQVVAVAPRDTGKNRLTMGLALFPVGLVLIQELSLRATVPVSPMLQLFSEDGMDRDSDGEVLRRGGNQFGWYISAVLRASEF
jgi:hypothetical protein